jgi:tripartite-type tricarboxylate transporter receptor subunit TctC
MRLSAPLLLCMLSIPTAASAQANKDVEDFFKGKTIRIVVSAEPGGSYDTYSRLIARHLGRFLPGAPKFYVSNMPGAGGVVAANWLYNIAPKDGTVLGQVQRQVPLMQILGEEGPKFETAKLNWLGSMANETTVCISGRDNAVKTFDDLRKQELIVASSGPNTSKNIPILLNNLLAAKFKIVSGYPSQAATALAVERGEAGGLCTSYTSLSLTYGKWFRGTDKVNILVQGGLKRHPDMPLAMEIATKADDKALIELFDTPSYVGYPYVLPPDVPIERVKAFRLAFDQMVKDKEFVAENAKESRELAYVSGDEMQKLYERLAQEPKATTNRLNDALKQ